MEPEYKEELFLFRDTQERTVAQLLSPKIHPPTIVLHGVSCTGKTSLIKKILRNQCQNHHAYVDCRLMDKGRDVFETAANQFSCQEEYRSSEYHAVRYKRMRLVNLNNFAVFLKDVVIRPDKTFFLVLDNFLHLQSLDSSLLPGFVRLDDMLSFQSQGKKRCCVILIDQSWPRDFNHLVKGKTSSLHSVHFPQYTKNQLIKILQSKKMRDEISCKDWNSLIKWLVPFFNHTRYLKDFYLLLMQLEPNIDEYLKNPSGRTLLEVCRPVCINQLTQYLGREGLKRGQKIQFEESCLDKNNQTAVLDLALSEATKILLLAGFLASYNSQKTDRKIFVSEEQIKRMRVYSKSRKSENRLLEGPKAFPLQRMLAMFDVLWRMKNTSARPIDIFQQVALLENLGLLSAAGGEFSDMKYSCNISYNYAYQLSKNARIRIEDFLAVESQNITDLQLQ